MNLFHVKVQTSTIHPDQGIPRLRLPNLALESGKIKFVERNLSELDGWADIAEAVPKDARLDFAWGVVEIRDTAIKVEARLPGEYSIPVPICRAGETDILLIQLTVIQDPWVLLMQEKDPPLNAPYQKEAKVHNAEFAGSNNGHVVAASRRGQGHACHGTFRDDDYKIEQFPDKGISVLAVADGAGSAQYSREGSRLAVDAAVESLRSAIQKGVLDSEVEGGNDADCVGEILVSAAKASREAIANEVKTFNAFHSENDIKVSEHDYNTTILLTVVKAVPKQGILIAAFAIGDGAIVWVPEIKERFSLLSEPDDGDFAGETEFVTSNSVWMLNETNHQAFLKRRVRLIRLAEEEALRGSLLMMTDGVSDPFFASHAKLKEFGLWRSFVDMEIRKKANVGKNDQPSGELSNRLLSWLNFKANTHFDDRTLVIWELFDTNNASIEHNAILSGNSSCGKEERQ